jgi:hypothetical protein
MNNISYRLTNQLALEYSEILLQYADYQCIVKCV